MIYFTLKNGEVMHRHYCREVAERVADKEGLSIKRWNSMLNKAWLRKLRANKELVIGDKPYGGATVGDEVRKETR